MSAIIRYLFDHILLIVFYLLALLLQWFILNGLNASDLIQFMMAMTLTLTIWIPFVVDMIRYFMVISRFKKAFSSLKHSEYITALVE